MSRNEFAPLPSAATARYWAATRERRLLLQWCPNCERHVHHPREACPGCLSTELQWRESAGRGTVHAVSVHYRPFAPMTAEDCPYAVAFVDLEDGVRFLANVTADDLEAIRVGDPVSLQWSPIADGYHLPVFHANAH